MILIRNHRLSRPGRKEIPRWVLPFTEYIRLPVSPPLPAASRHPPPAVGCSRLQASDGAPPDHPRIWQVAIRSCHPSRIVAVPLLCAAIVAGVRLAATMLPTTCCAFLRRPIRRSNGTPRFRGSEQGAWLRPIRRDQALPAADAFR
jgi:hypothetical protein